MPFSCLQFRQNIRFSYANRIFFLRHRIITQIKSRINLLKNNRFQYKKKARNLSRSLFSTCDIIFHLYRFCLERYEYIDGITSSQPKFDNSTEFTVSQCMNPGITKISEAWTLIFLRPDLDIQKRKKGEKWTKIRSCIHVPKWMHAIALNSFAEL